MTEPASLDAHELLTTTRAVRRRLDLERAVPRELVEECVQIALQAPSGGNRRAYRFVVVDDPEQRERVAAVYRKAFEIYRAGPTVATKAFEGDAERTAVQERVFDSVEHLARNLHRVPALVIPCMAGRAQDKQTVRAQAGFWGSVFPAVWSFQLAARQRGLGTALTTMHLEFEREVADVLAIPHDEYTQVCLLPLAFTTGGGFRPAQREPAEHFLRWNSWT
ncbi:nitroreductase family protein [Nocardioides humi]|uniref:Nitroreductase family protein n=1 Tax=Nocardioides humi TaxID=449461 RepID=A0ABN2A9Q2_9ACTN|nr:nitroreductase family protein [Nocardioides humi]